MRGRFGLYFIGEIGSTLKESVDNIVGSISNNLSQKATLLESIQKVQDSTRQITNIITVIKKRISVYIRGLIWPKSLS